MFKHFFRSISQIFSTYIFYPQKSISKTGTAKNRPPHEEGTGKFCAAGYITLQRHLCKKKKLKKKIKKFLQPYLGLGCKRGYI